MLDDHVAGHNLASVYRKLDDDKQEIRLLTVQQGIREEPVCCSLNYTFLTEPFPDSYETISYVWGDERCRGSIILNGSLFDVPASAEEVLRRVRLVHTARKVWIDAVCINQKDVRERESQVAIRSEIYGKTWRNLVWLGPDRERINERAIASITVILDDVRLETANFGHYVSKLYSQDQRFQFSGTGMSLNIDWDAFDLYMAATWFTRLWVVQEAVLATQSICLRGNTELPLTDVLRAACWVLHKSMFLPADLGRSRGVSCAVTIAMYADQEFGAYNFFHSQEAGSVALSSILDGMRVFDARDNRDYVYELLGLYKKYSGCVVLPTCLKPDYTNAYTQVFREVARITILEHAELTIFENIQRRPLAEYVPSWVPLYHVKYDVEMDEIEVGEGSFRACGGLNLELADIQSPKDQNTLTLKGFQISQISEIGDEFTRESCLQNKVAAYTKLLDKAEKMLNEVPNLSAHQRIQPSLIHFAMEQMDLENLYNILKAWICIQLSPNAFARTTLYHFYLRN